LIGAELINIGVINHHIGLGGGPQGGPGPLWYLIAIAKGLQCGLWVLGFGEL
jgi:hypothetical protein